MNPHVKSLRHLGNYQIELQFTNGEIRVFDASPYLDKGVFRSLQSEPNFRSARVVDGSVEWIGEIDLSYNTLYLGSVPLNNAKF